MAPATGIYGGMQELDGLLFTVQGDWLCDILAVSNMLSRSPLEVESSHATQRSMGDSDLGGTDQLWVPCFPRKQIQHFVEYMMQLASQTWHFRRPRCLGNFQMFHWVHVMATKHQFNELTARRGLFWLTIQEAQNHNQVGVLLVGMSYGHDREHRVGPCSNHRRLEFQNASQRHIPKDLCISPQAVPPKGSIPSESATLGTRLLNHNI